MVPPCSSKIPRVPLYSSSPTKFNFRIQGYHLLWLTFPGYFTNIIWIQWLDYFRFARRYSGNLNWFLFLWLLRCFSSPGLLLPSYKFGWRYSTCVEWVFPFGNLRVKACLSAYRSLSQITTSFIALCRQGIHHMRLFTWPYNLKNALKKQFLNRFSSLKVTFPTLYLLNTNGLILILRLKCICTIPNFQKS